MNMQCPICHSPHASIRKTTNTLETYMHCPRCGDFDITQQAINSFGFARDDKWAILSHVIKKSSVSGEPVKVDTKFVDAVKKNEILPNPQIQANYLINFLGNSTEPSKWVSDNISNMAGILGTIDDPSRPTQSGVLFIIASLKQKNLLEDKQEAAKHLYRLTFDGWEYYEKLKRGQEATNNIFMAMAFAGEDCPSDLRKFYQQLKINIPARTGLNFGNPLQDQGKAGLIHARMEAEIRQAKLVVADLSHCNNGAYWEAGFASALGKPVIYTMNQSWWKAINAKIDENFKSGSASVYKMLTLQKHFDAAPHYHVEWNSDNMQDAENQLVDAIRASLPGQVKMKDDEETQRKRA